MTSFKDKVLKKREIDAYKEGTEAYRNGKREKLLRSPYTKDSKADWDWLDGFYDAWYMDIVTGGRSDKF